MSEIDISDRVGASFVSVRRWHAGPEWAPRAHAHPFCEIIVVLRGTEEVEIEGRPLYCNPGQCMFYPPGCVHQERQTGPDTLEFLCLDFEWGEVPPCMPHTLHDRQGRVQELVRWILAADRSGYADRADYQDSATRLLAAELTRLIKSPNEEPLARAYEYIQEHLAEPISLDELAIYCRLNKFHLNRIFRARTGVTPMEYVRLARLDYAHRLLLETDLPLREIAPRSGFANEYHLSRLIKVRFGRGARDLRRAKAEESDPAE